jgi:hypothetical protein
MTTPISTPEQRVNRGANWFYWIAGLSLVNSIASVAEAKVTFPVGLGITQVFDGLAAAFKSQTATIVGLCADGLAACLVVLVGYFAHRQRWVYILGMVLYGLDGVINLVFQDWMGAGFHAFALYSMSVGLVAFKQLQQQQQAAALAGATVSEPIQPSAL